MLGNTQLTKGEEKRKHPRSAGEKRKIREKETYEHRTAKTARPQRHQKFRLSTKKSRPGEQIGKGRES